MKLNKPIIFYLPDKLYRELDEYLKINKLSFSHKIEYFYYIIHVLTNLSNRNKDYEYHSLNMKKLKNVTVSNIERYIRILKNGEFIISDKKYEAGKKNLWYKIAPKHQKGIKKITLSPDKRLYKNIKRQQYNRKAHDNRLQPFLKRMKDEFINMEFNYHEIQKWITNNASEDKKSFYMTSINALQDKQFRYFERNKTNNRLDTNLTNLKSDFRQFIIGDYVSIDLKNAQPFFLTLLINQILNNNIINYPLCCYFSNYNPAETFGKTAIQRILLFHQKEKNANLVNLRRFTDTTKSGIFYDAFASSYPSNVSRGEVKDIMFKVLFSRDEQYTNYKRIVPFQKEKAIFKEVYPFIYEVITILKDKDHSKLAITLQQMESLIFIDHISKELVNRDIVPLTIHDSIIVERKDHEQTVKVIMNVFKQHCGIVPSFHINDIKKPNNERIDRRNKRP